MRHFSSSFRHQESPSPNGKGPATRIGKGPGGKGPAPNSNFQDRKRFHRISWRFFRFAVPRNIQKPPSRIPHCSQAALGSRKLHLPLLGYGPCPDLVRHVRSFGGLVPTTTRLPLAFPGGKAQNEDVGGLRVRDDAVPPQSLERVCVDLRRGQPTFLGVGGCPRRGHGPWACPRAHTLLTAAWHLLSP